MKKRRSDCNFIALCAQNCICFRLSKSQLFAAVDDVEHCLTDVQEKLRNSSEKGTLS